MRSRQRVCLPLLILLGGLIFQGNTVSAQVPNDVLVTATSNGGAIVIAVDLDIGGDLPADWVGWVIDRSTIGNCDDPVVQIGDTTPFPAGAQSYVLTDLTAQPMTTYKYRIYAVNAAGERSYLPGDAGFPPAYYHFDYASLADGYVAEGQLLDLGWTVGIDVCPEGCWEDLAFISNPPAEFDHLLGTGVTVLISGQLDADFEGPYVSEVTGWTIIPGCSPVESVQTDWSRLKALYR